MSNYEYSWHLMRTLSERISSANSVTEELERWCCERGISQGRLVATYATGVEAKFLDARSLEALHADAHAKPELRRVQLAIDGVVVADALNWYFPANLTPEICDVLRTSSVPFGRHSAQNDALSSSGNPRPSKLLVPATRPRLHLSTTQSCLGGWRSCRRRARAVSNGPGQEPCLLGCTRRRSDLNISGAFNDNRSPPTLSSDTYGNPDNVMIPFRLTLQGRSASVNST